MPEYMTKSEPVDKKPYIVYTDKKGILYSGDPDSDIPGGGGGSATYSITCYDNSPMPSTIDPACYRTEVAVAHDEEFDEDKYYLRKVGEPVTEAAAGEVLISSDSSTSFAAVFSKSPSDYTGYQFPTPGNVMQADGTELTAFVMPAHDVHVKVGR